MRKCCFLDAPVAGIIWHKSRQNFCPAEYSFQSKLKGIVLYSREKIRMETTLNKGLPLDITDKNFIRIPHLISEEEEEPINCSSLPPSHSLSLSFSRTFLRHSFVLLHHFGHKCLFSRRVREGGRERHCCTWARPLESTAVRNIKTRVKRFRRFSPTMYYFVPTPSHTDGRRTGVP